MSCREELQRVFVQFVSVFLVSRAHVTFTVSDCSCMHILLGMLQLFVILTLPYDYQMTVTPSQRMNILYQSFPNIHVPYDRVR